MGPNRTTPPLILDAGALIAVDRNDRSVIDLVELAWRTGQAVLVPAGVLAQVWRSGRRQAAVARVLKAKMTRVVPLDEGDAKASGVLCGETGTADVIDASVVVVAGANPTAVVVTSDPDDMRRLEPKLDVEVC